ncbi:hypothetical protein ASC77_00505 [Nocardioides sp. Root1257]|uniref:hypothetical protein n=1 Tax=unclassified Nocardioides TaxID=2615069 RepID=UPI0006F4FEFC|nr:MULTISPECIES: hypothetical protein [unclassified Nocardioides]KQW52837.1 hypothetical protein ASC77_00505 [Nocardioides sp. Root1257]KRC55525.1 hypothetical protein ASE24_00505 [Nocardioides sp. Root224]
MKTLVLAAVLPLLVACGSEERSSPPREPAAPPLSLPPASGDQPAPIVARADGAPAHDAWQGSFCSETMCADMIAPPWDELPVLGAASDVEAGFAEPGDWTVTLGSDDRRCATYPVQLVPTGTSTFRLVPTGPAGEYRLDVFIYPDSGGDTSGSFRWTTPEASAPTAWVHLHQNSEHSGGMGTVQVVLDDAAVDGDVHGTVTVGGADARETFRLSPSDQGCHGDRYVTLAPVGSPDRRVGGLGAGPYDVQVDVVVDGVHHRAHATSAPDAEDTTLVFEPILPT